MKTFRRLFLFIFFAQIVLFAKVRVYADGIATQIMEQPVGDTVCEDNSYLFTVLAEGTNLKYQWYLNGNAIVGATDDYYSIMFARPQDQGYYSVVVSGDNGVVMSDSVYFAVRLASEKFIVFEWPDVPTVNCNSAVNGGFVFKRFQWYRDDMLIPGAVKPYYQIPKNSPKARYYCVLETEDGQIFSICEFTVDAPWSSIAVYPNPTTGLMTVDISNYRDEYNHTQMVAYYFYGTVAAYFFVNGPKTTIDFSLLPSGVYWLTVLDERFKIIKN